MIYILVISTYVYSSNWSAGVGVDYRSILVKHNICLTCEYYKKQFFSGVVLL